jgi:ubiquinone biosynthesis protein
VVDFGQAVNLDRDTTRQLLLLLLALINHDNDGAIRAMYRMGMLSKHNISQALRRDLQRFMDRYIDRPLSEVSFRETGDELMAMSHRHGARMPSQIAMLIKTLVMAEGIGLQIDPQLDVFRIAEPHARQALAEQFSPGFVAGQVKGTVRDLSETMLALPEQLGSVLQQLDEGKLVVQTHEEDLRRVSGALIGAANRLAVALVLVALILGMAMLSIAVSLGQWSGTWLVIIFIAGGVGIVITALVLGFALMRGRNG